MPDNDKQMPKGFAGLEDMVSRVVISAPPPSSFPGTSPLYIDEKSGDLKKHTKFNPWAKLAFGAGVLLVIVLITKLSVNSNRDTSSKVSPTHSATPTHAPSDSKPQPVPKTVGLFDDILADGASEAKPKTVRKSVSIEEFLGPEKASTPSKSPKPAKDKEWWKGAPLAGEPAQTKGGELVPYNGIVLPLTPSAKRPENGYLKGERQTLAGGLSSFTIDNSAGSHDAEIRLYGNGAQVRSMFVRVGATFTANKLAPGTYRMRYKMTINGRPRAFEAKEDFVLSETTMETGTRFSRVKVTLYTLKNGNMQTEEIPLEQF